MKNTNNWEYKIQQGNYLQLNDSILQIENEYYSTIRPKQIAHLGERPACALLRRGVEYVEVRLLDIDPFSDIGIQEHTADFIEVFLIAAMLSKQEYYSDEAIIEARNNTSLVAKYGRQENIQLQRHGQSITLQDWLNIILNDCLFIAGKMDINSHNNQFSQAVYHQIEKMNNVNKTPSAEVINQVSKSGLTHQAWMTQHSQKLTERLRNYQINKSAFDLLKQEAKTSKEQWLKLEKYRHKECDFKEYLKQYYDNVC